MDAFDEFNALTSNLQPSKKQATDLELELYEDPSLTGTAREELLTALHEHEASKFRITVRQKCLVHGTYTDNSDPATLLGLQFELRKTDAGQHRRFRHFKVALRFETEPLQQPAQDPFVKSFAPAQQGVIYLLPTLVHKTVETNKEASLGVQQDPVPLSLALTAGKTKGEEWDQMRKATISAQAYKTHSRGGGRGGEDVVEWTFTENEKEESLPDTFTVAVVLRRIGDARFKVHFDIEAKIDFWYGLETFWQKVKNKTTFKAVREASKIFDPNEQGDEPTSTVKSRQAELLATGNAASSKGDQAPNAT
ncbi:uncharacterized protein BDZ99DRAFT_206205 [Mytilinidion resinicola]|uniref:Uncharacterized protein n=1 Tax=Mytilinidion resinicola TaxID=574789 RepID=A0A6A6Y1K2_9PEZI|nr:uncharacterized protein BDZ99DRAFT_206205 [Mytilinidion resinicola]KAF2802519.1 hypothetical protein BDZ99DRAFT_206205 [Mytilinidion resinicola]